MYKYYPIMMNIKGKSCKVIGGGSVAERKVTSLLEYGALVTVISPTITDKLKDYSKNGKIELINRNYSYGDLNEAYLVYAATHKEETNRDCLRECREKGILINLVDNLESCDFIIPASVKRGHLNISVSTNGKSPMLSRRIKQSLEKIFTYDYEEYLGILGEIRERVKKEVNDIEVRREIFKRLVYSDIFDRYLAGEKLDLKEELFNIYISYIKRLQGDESGE